MILKQGTLTIKKDGTLVIRNFKFRTEASLSDPSKYPEREAQIMKDLFAYVMAVFIYKNDGLIKDFRELTRVKKHRRRDT